MSSSLLSGCRVRAVTKHVRPIHYTWKSKFPSVVSSHPPHNSGTWYEWTCTFYKPSSLKIERKRTKGNIEPDIVSRYE